MLEAPAVVASFDDVAATGCEIIFHKLPIRPGKPVLAAVGHSNRVVMGLPGNPLAVLVILRRMVLPVLRRLAGFREPAPATPMVTLPPKNPAIRSGIARSA